MFELPSNKSPNLTLYPLLWLAICFSCGILTAKLLVFDWKISLGFSLISAFLTIFFLKREFAFVFPLVTFLFLGAFLFQIENHFVAPNRLKILIDENRITSNDPIEIEGVLRGKPELSADGFFLELKAQKITYKNAEHTVSGLIRLFAASENSEIADEYARLNLQYGSRIRVACKLRREETYLNPGVISRLKIHDEQGIDATATIKSPFLIEKIGDETIFAPLAWIYEQRQNLIIEFSDRFSISTAGILIASLLGNKHFLDKPTAELFREGGTFHILVISGLHITFIGGLIILFVRFFSRSRFWQFIVASVLLWAYALAVGAEVPVVRAAVMFTILLFSRVIYRNGTLLNLLGACALILLVWRPNDLFSASFQLTFVSVAAIVGAAFPLIENLRKIGAWMPTTESPFPPRVPGWLRKFCETVYWREEVWEIDTKRQIWSARLFKSPHLKWLETKNLQGIFQYLFEGVLVSLVVQIWLLPFSIIYFHRVSPISVFLNLWVGFFIALESFAAVFAVFLIQVSSILAFPFIVLTEILNSILLSIPGIFVENDWASFRVPNYSGEWKIVYLVYFLPVIFLTAALNFWKPFELSTKFKIQNSKFIVRFVFSAMVFFILLITFHPWSAPKADGKLRVDFLDVGQGDSALITFPNSETLLIDGGGQPNFAALKRADNDEPEFFEPDAPTIGESVVSAFLWEKGYSKIDYILATHADADHIQSLTDVAKNFRVRAAFFGRTTENDADFVELNNVLQKRNVEVIKLKRGDVLEFGEAKIEIFYPEKDESGEAISGNNHSIVLRLIFGNKKILFTGDIERETESVLVENPAFLQASLVKVAHHGSRTSSTPDFVSATRAEYAVISVGRRSRFGHPHKEIVERWKNAGAKVLTTGERGTITISTDGKNFEIQTFVR
jgi:competence protein ComEC